MIKKFPTFEDAANHRWVNSTDKNYYDRLKKLFRFWSKLNNRNIQKGIQKFKSYQEFLNSKIPG